MRVSQKSVEAMPAYNIKQVSKRKNAERVLAKAQNFEAEMQGKVDSYRAKDGQAEDQSPAKDVVVTLKGEKKGKSYDHSWTEANFENGALDVEHRSYWKRPPSSYSYLREVRNEKRWTAKSNGNTTRYFQSQYTGQKAERHTFETNEYSFKELVVTDVNGEKTYNFREGTGHRHMIWNGIRAAGSSIGGFLGPALGKFSKIKIKVGGDETGGPR